MSASPGRRYRFLPGRPLVAAAAAVLGFGLLVSSLLGAPMPGRGFSIGLGAAALVLALLYLLSPAWRTEVLVDEAGLEVLNRGDRRFRLPWTEVVSLVAAPASASAFVDGGTPDRSLLLPGPGARAPYRIAGQRELFEEIRARVPAERTTEVERLRPRS